MPSSHKNVMMAVLLSIGMNAWGQAPSKTSTQKVEKVKLSGYVGQRYQDCLEHRVKTENLDTLIQVFTRQDEVNQQWGSEFWGKWMLGAIDMYHYTQDPELKALIQQAQDRLIALQLPNGYIGNYDPEHQLTGWDVWGRKYTLLGLIKWYQETGQTESLEAARKLLDYTMTQIPSQKPIVLAGLYKGMPPASILEAVMMVYGETKDPRYLDFAKYIVEDIESPQGPQLIAKAHEPVAKRFNVAGKDWWSALNGQKAYEMMSCHVGMLELYRVTGEAKLLEATQALVQHIMDEEINICGSGTAFECWYGGKRKQTRLALHTMETCVTFTWMQLLERLMEFEHNPVLADVLERTFYNAAMGSLKNDASNFLKYLPLEGHREKGEDQCGLPINCCVANGPRAWAMIPRVQYQLPRENRIDINLYIPGEAVVKLGKRQVAFKQETDYPRQGKVVIEVNPDKETNFTLGVRIPSWAPSTTLSVNGNAVSNVRNGHYSLITRDWKKGDKIELNIPLRGRITEINHMQAIERGPIVLARDSRFHDGPVDESCVISRDRFRYVELEEVTPPNGMWMAFKVKGLKGAYHDGDSYQEDIHFCDFQSAGNTWETSDRYRVWLPRCLDVRSDRF